VAFEGEPLDAILQPVGSQAARSASTHQPLAGGSLVVFMWVAFEPGARVPKKLDSHHRRVRELPLKDMVIDFK
jgi:hypothetical protein